jgi:amino acid transporter
MIFPFLSFLAVGTSSAQVITWLANLTEASQIIDYICMCAIYLCFYRALKAQGFDRKDLPYIGWFQPYCAWFGLITMIITVSVYGYTTFLPGWWDIGTFFSYYTMVFLCPILYVGWKVVKKTHAVKPEECDLVWERPVIDAYEAIIAGQHMGFWEEVRMMAGLKKKTTAHLE